VEHRKKELIGFKLFIIMELDDCSIEMRNRFLDKEIFSKHWLYDYIMPIYNDPDLEQTMYEAGIEIQKMIRRSISQFFQPIMGIWILPWHKLFWNH